LQPSGPMVGKIVSMGLYSGLKIETTLDPRVQPFLHDHQIDGTPLLPGVMGIEAFAEAALSVLPGWHIKAIEDVNFLAPFKFYRNEARAVRVEATIRAQAEELVVDCRLLGCRTLPNQSEPQSTTHFTARVRLTKCPPGFVTGSAPGSQIWLTIGAADIYRLYFHGPAYQVLEKAWWDGDRMIGLLAKDLPSNHSPANLPTLMLPRLIELCFQTAGLWEMGTQDRMGLPQHIDYVSSFALPPSPDVRLHAVVTPRKAGTFDAEVVDAQGNRFVHLKGYRTVATPNAVNGEQVKTLRTMLAAPVAA
jgi:3-hydroxymyristoyl/3-hydroxydecanoyl-(acyl carrier protein) dehydratase